MSLQEFCRAAWVQSTSWCPSTPLARPLPQKTVKGAATIRAFDIECEAWLSVAHHRNIARAFAFGTWEGTPSVLVDWYPRSLASVKPEEFSDEALEQLFRQTVAALEFALNEAGLIHQDVKPANILLDSKGRVRLADFGLARCISRESRNRIDLGLGSLSHVVDGNISGTPFFMAPELWEGTKASVRTDLSL